MVLKVYSRDSARSAKVLITAKYANIDVTEVNEFDSEVAHHVATGKFPILETAEGYISEANAIVRYLAHSGSGKHLYGKNHFEAGLIDSWIDFSVEIELASYAWLFPIQKIIPNNPLATKKAQEDVKKVLKLLDDHLLTRTYLVGNYISLADIVVGNALVQLYQLVLDPAFRAEFVNTNRWFVTLVHQPEFAAVLGEVHLAEKAAVAPAKQEKAPKEKKEKPEKQEKPKKEQPKKEEKPKEEAPADDGEEEDEYADKEDSKKKNPLDLLPKSPLVLDEWKRVYSNNDTRAMALPWFFEHFDKEGYSLFYCDYKYNNELSKTFMTSNLIGGFFQRLEKLHKYAFGSMIIFGDEPELSVSGVWLFRGSEVPAEMKEADDYEHYNWRPLNIADAGEKALFEDFLAWDGAFGGRKFNAGKVFK